ncbi:MAG: hypothetical protein RI918_2007 [Pseudomonadota bacterium]
MPSKLADPTAGEAPQNTEHTSADFSPAYLSVLGAALLAACSGNEDGSSASTTANATATQSDTAIATNATGADASFANQADSVSGYRPPNATINNGIPAAAGFNNFPVAYTTNDAARFLMQSQFNASDAEIAAVQATTFAAYLQQQYAKPIGQTGVQWLDARGYSVSDKNSFFYQTYPGEGMIWNQLFTSQDGMRKRVALALSEFFVVSQVGLDFTWQSYALAQYWDLLVKNAFGNYRQALEDVTLSAAMGYYLNTRGNEKENSSGRVPDENYAREVMQLFSIGLYQLNLDGTEKLDGNGKKIETYSQSDVTNLARVFTGYNFDNAVGKGTVNVYDDKGVLQTYKVDTKESVLRPMALTVSKHSTLAASFLGTSIPAQTPGTTALQIALNTLYNHPNVGPFLGKQMIQRLVTSNPSPAYVARVAAAFNNNGAGVRGDLKAVWTAIFLDDEARRTYTVSTAPMPTPPAGSTIRNAEGRLNRNIADKAFGKLREPMLRFVQWGRTFGLGPAEAGFVYWKIPETSNPASSLGQSPFRSPSVFNFFRPGFIPPSSALAATNTTAPEFQLVNETTVGGYLNYMQDIIRNGFRSYIDPAVPQAFYPQGVPGYPKLHSSATYISELAMVTNVPALVQRINLLMAAGQISDANQTLMITAISSMPLITLPANPTAAQITQLTNQRLDRVSAAILMVMASSEYLIQK